MNFTAIRFLTSVLRPRERTLAVFGEARLIKHLDGRIECRGGSVEDRRQAREWCSHFLHNAAIDVRPLPSSWDHRHGRGPLSHIPALRSPLPAPGSEALKHRSTEAPFHSPLQALRSTLPAFHKAA